MKNTANFISKPNSVTFHEKVELPKMPSDNDEFDNLPLIKMPRAKLIEGKLIFDMENGIEEALQFGFFLVRISSDIDLTSGDLFVRNFYKEKTGTSENDKYRGFKYVTLNESYQGYFDREFDQWENFYIESANWDRYLPSGLCLLGHKMTDFGISILKNIFEYLKIPRDMWSTITSGLSEKKGHQMLAFNHFRSDKAVRGSKFHRDSGWITILRSTEPGLVAFINNKLYAVNPEPEYFIVNFGSSIEVLTAKLKTPARGNIHGVVRTIRNNSEENRTSYVVFLDSNLKGNIYQLEEIDKPVIVQTVAEFAIQEVNRTYDENNSDL